MTLSWGQENELLLGSSSLRLLQTTDEEFVIWYRRVPTPVKFAHFSSDASLIASTGFYDPLVKIWRRQSFGSDDTRFDFTYLSHPAVVTGVDWRRRRDGDHAREHVLYSICADKKIRIWAVMNPHGLQALQMWAEIDMLESIQPRASKQLLQSDSRYAFFIDSDDFSRSTALVLERAKEDKRKEHHVFDHLSEISQRSPELCMIMDTNGHMSAWGIEGIGFKAAPTMKIFNVMHVDDCDLSILLGESSQVDNLQLFTFNDQTISPRSNVLIHNFDGRIQWLETNPSKFLDPSPCQDRTNVKALWTGHDSAIKKIVRNHSGSALISRTSDNEGVVWRQQRNKSSRTLTRASALCSSKHIHRTILLQNGDLVANLHHNSISLWDTRSPLAKLIATCGHDLEGRLLCLILLPQSGLEPKVAYLATVSSKMKGIVWEVPLRHDEEPHAGMSRCPESRVKQFCTFEMRLKEDLASMLPVDPAGSPLLTSGFHDSFAKDVAVSYTDRGELCTWTASLAIEHDTVNWLCTSSLDTGIVSPSLASASSNRKSALVDSSRTGLTIWDMRSGQLEHEVQYKPNYLVQDLDWSSTPDDQSILAVGFSHTVIILAQMRYDYLSKGPAWAPIREVQIRDTTPHPIGDSTWLGNGNLVIGAGHQLFLYDKEITMSDDMPIELSIPVHEHKAMDLFNLVSFLNGSLPVFHPQFMGQCILAGKARQVQRIIVGLCKALRFFSSGDTLDSFVAYRLKTSMRNEK